MNSNQSPQFMKHFWMIAGFAMAIVNGFAADSGKQPEPQSAEPAESAPATEKATGAFTELPPKKDFVRLYLYRIGKFSGSAIRPVVKIDGIELGRLGGGKYLACYIRPGAHSLETKLSWANYPIKGGTVLLDVPAGSELYLEYVADAQLTGASQYHVSALYKTGFVVAQPENAKPAIQSLVQLLLDPERLANLK